ncbi:MAG TPA: 50S ribosomal protein L16 [Anaerolineales bacterium]|nr:50S ribosomal protein L16 [Anaerolineales bacterium]
MLMPKRAKWRKQSRGRMKGLDRRGAEVSFGEYGLQALEPGWVTARQIEAARRSLVRYMKRRGKVWIRIFPDKPVTQKAAETRMGKGKGAVDHYVAVVRPGRVLFELSGLPEANAREALRLASHKLSIKTRFIERLDMMGASD